MHIHKPIKNCIRAGGSYVDLCLVRESYSPAKSPAGRAFSLLPSTTPTINPLPSRPIRPIRSIRLNRPTPPTFPMPKKGYKKRNILSAFDNPVLTALQKKGYKNSMSRLYIIWPVITALQKKGYKNRIVPAGYDHRVFTAPQKALPGRHFNTSLTLPAWLMPNSPAVKGI